HFGKRRKDFLLRVVDVFQSVVKQLIQRLVAFCHVRFLRNLGALAEKAREGRSAPAALCKLTSVPPNGFKDFAFKRPYSPIAIAKCRDPSSTRRCDGGHRTCGS